MKTISLRGIDEKTAAKLKKEALRKNLSVNALILQIIQRGIGLKAPSDRRRVFHDLDALAGTWTEKEAVDFLDSIRDFEEVDEELWREANTAGH